MQIVLTALWLGPFARAGDALTVVYFEDYPPYSFRDAETGALRGILIDVNEEILANRLGLTVVHQGLPWARAQHFVKTGQADAYCTVPTPERRAYMLFTREPVLIASMRVFTRHDHPQMEQLKQVTSTEQLQQYTISVYIGSGWAKGALEGMEVFWPHSLEQSLVMVAHGRADISVGVARVMAYQVKRLGLDNQIVELKNDLSRAPFHFGLARHSSYVEYLPDYERELAKMVEDGSLERILVAY